MIRNFAESDARHLSEIQSESIATLGPRQYAPEQVSAWLDRARSSSYFLERHAGQDTILVATDERDRPCGYVLLEPDGHLDHIYVHPGASGHGHATALLAEARAWAADHKVETLFSEVSEVARPVFERAGWRVKERRDFEIDGVAIHNYAMLLDVPT